MIKGVGVDLVEIKRFQDKSDLDDFLHQILAQKEYDETKNHARKYLIGAKLFAIKEAIMKALGCGLNAGSYWHDIETTNNSTLCLSGYLSRLADESSISKIHLSHSCSKRFSVAVVILEQ
jgi:holo-[acyl-carrier protein] synthase